MLPKGNRIWYPSFGTPHPTLHRTLDDVGQKLILDDVGQKLEAETGSRKYTIFYFQFQSHV